MQRLEVTTDNGSYPIIIENDLAKKLIEYIPDIERYSAFVIITDENVYDIYGEQVDAQLYQTEKLVETIVLPAGDESKSLEVYDQVIETMLERYIPRTALVIAFGGGMIGDFAGFVAATYMRGIDFVQIPTTLLAHDSAIGGKVALNHVLAKNVIGAFHQPKAVLYDPQLLQTLPDIEWISGFGEVIKHHEIDPTFDLEIPKRIEDIRLVEHYLKDSMEVKRNIVEQDPYEQGKRVYLNYGHTFGHALEQHLQYQLPHGICVLYGLLFVALLERRDVQVYQHILGLVPVAKLQLSEEDFQTLITYMKRDKKQESNTLSFLIKEGDMLRMKAFDELEIKETYKQFLEMV